VIFAYGFAVKTFNFQAVTLFLAFKEAVLQKIWCLANIKTAQPVEIV